MLLLKTIVSGVISIVHYMYMLLLPQTVLLSVFWGESRLDLANVEAISLLETIVVMLIEGGEGFFFPLGSPKSLNFQLLFQEAIDKSLRLEKNLHNSNNKELHLKVLFQEVSQNDVYPQCCFFLRDHPFFPHWLWEGLQRYLSFPLWGSLIFHMPELNCPHDYLLVFSWNSMLSWCKYETQPEKVQPFLV